MLLSNYRPLFGVRANLVQGTNGEFSDSTGSSRGLSNAQDLALLKHLRSLADIVVTDGETARREQYRIPLGCDLGVITRQGFEPAPSKSTRKYLELKDLSLDMAIGKLKELGYQRILLEVGPGLFAGCWGLVDELCLTTTGFGTPSLAGLGVSANCLACRILGESTFSVWSQIRTL